MVLSIKDKKRVVIEINKIAEKALSALIVNFHGITVEKLTELRKIASKSDVYIRVVRNTLLYRAISGTSFECLRSAIFGGPTMIVYSMEHPGSAARIFKEFLRKNSKLEIKAAAFNGKLISAFQVDYLANLPTYKEAVVSLILIIKEAIAGKLLRTLVTIRYLKESN